MTRNLINQVISARYHVQEVIGRGGMAEVYKVWDRQRNTYLALKLLQEEYLDDPAILASFQLEAEALSELQHPNIVRYYGHEKDGTRAFVLMDYIDGENLKTAILQKEKKHPAYQQIIEILKPVCIALHYAHTRGIVHCDIKPGNVMITKQGQVVLTDFGIAMRAEGANSKFTGAGTPTHMAPEQIQGGTPTPQTDIYSLGVLLYEILTGGNLPFTGQRAPRTGDTTKRIQWEHLNLPPPPLRDFKTDIHPDFNRIVFKCLEKDPARRYKNTIELLNDFSMAVNSKVRPVLGTKDHPLRKMTPRFNRPMIEALMDLPVNRLWMGVAAFIAVCVLVLVKLLTNTPQGGILASRTASPEYQTSQPVLVPSSTTRPLPLVIPSETPLPTPVVVPSDTPRPVPQVFVVNECMRIPLGGANVLQECVTQVTIQADGSMRFDFSWTAYVEAQFEVQKGSDQNNTNIYLTDGVGNRYDHYQTGGDAARDVTIRNGEQAIGWFLFPQAFPGVKTFIFHDDDNQMQTAPIILE